MIFFISINNRIQQYYRNVCIVFTLYCCFIAINVCILWIYFSFNLVIIIYWFTFNKFTFTGSFLLSKYFVLLELIFLLRLINLLSKSVFVIRFACTNLSTKRFAVNVLNSGIGLCSSWWWSVSFFSISLIFVS